MGVVATLSAGQVNAAILYQEDLTGLGIAQLP